VTAVCAAGTAAAARQKRTISRLRMPGDINAYCRPGPLTGFTKPTPVAKLALCAMS
jgi:hypothetical protein